MTQAEIGIVIVTYESGAEIGACLDAAQKTGSTVVVVDNASQDGTCAEVERRGVLLVRNSRNRGFAAAVNQGVCQLTMPFILLLNPDAVMEHGIGELVACCRKQGVAGACGRLLGRDGTPQVGFMVRRFPTILSLLSEVLLVNRIWPRNPVNWNYRCLGLDYSTELNVEQPAGAFLMFRREVWEQLGGFDESFHPLWFEDVDFCRRAWDSGYRFRYTPLAVAKHTGGHSIPKIPLEIRQIYWYGNLLRYAARHFPPAAARLVCLAVIAGSAVRMLWGSIQNRSWTLVVAFARVMRLAGRSLITGRVAKI